MLNAELIKQSETLKDLSDDQISAIETLSKNDEQEVLNKRIGEIHGRYDEDVKAITGKEKPQGVKTYEHIKSVLTEFKTQAEKAAEQDTKVQELNTTIADLKQKIKANSGDETLKQELDEAKTELTNIKKTYAQEKEEWQQKITEKETALTTYKQRSILEKAAAGFKYKPEDIIPGDVKALTVENAIKSVLEEYEVAESEGKTVFKKNGEIVRDKDNNLEPMGPDKILSQKLKSIIEEGKPGGGGGGGPQPPNPKIRVSGARTQMEAEEIIEKQLLASGKVKGSDEYQTEKDKLWKENEISKLPIQ